MSARPDLRELWGPPSADRPAPVVEDLDAPAAPPPGEPGGTAPGAPYPLPYPPPSPAATGAARRAERRALAVGLLAGLVGGTLAAGVTIAARGTSGAAAVRIVQSGGAAPGSSAPRSVAAIAAAVLPSVVTIDERSASVHGTGSGIVLDGPAGLVLTNDHVVADAAADAHGVVTVVPAGRTLAQGVRATAVWGDPTTDLAVLQVPLRTLPSAALGRSAALRVGDAVVAVGAPLDLAGTVTQGIVSYLGRNVPVPSEDGSAADNLLVGAIQTDAAINPGNSGGALVDDRGRVIGITSAIASTGGSAAGLGGQSGSIGVGFAIPVDEAVVVAGQLAAAPHRVAHPFLGVRTQDSAAPAGALVAGVTAGGHALPAISPGSPAARAGLRGGDVITAVDGAPVAGADDLVAAVRAHRVGDLLRLDVARGGAHLVLRARLADGAAH